MGQTVYLFTEPLIGEHGYLFSGMKERIRVSQLMARVKAGGKALENVPVTSPSRVHNLDSRPPGASVIDEQKLLPSSLPEKRYPCSF
jgi:hypothetical protein